MFNLEKIKNFFKSLKKLKLSDFKNAIHKLVDIINEFKAKSKDLKNKL